MVKCLLVKPFTALVLVASQLTGCNSSSLSLNDHKELPRKDKSAAIEYAYTDSHIPTTLLLANASLQAYEAFDQENPEQCQRASVSVEQLPNYEFLECWQGHSFLKSRSPKTEISGVVFRSTSTPYTYIFAFRGTDSKIGVVSDVRTRKVAFSAFNQSSSVDGNVRVHNGFFKNYAGTSQRNKLDSMRDQLFGLINKYQHSSKPINKLLITGHSLGAALSTLFALDLVLEHPEIPSETINFASPKVGNSKFVDYYQQHTRQLETLRVVNSFDIVPCTPKLTYAHTSNAYLLGFYEEKKKMKQKKSKRSGAHSIFNYIDVLSCANQSDNGICNQTIVANREGGMIQLHSEKGNPDFLCKKVN